MTHSLDVFADHLPQPTACIGERMALMADFAPVGHRMMQPFRWIPLFIGQHHRGGLPLHAEMTITIL